MVKRLLHDLGSSFFIITTLLLIASCDHNGVEDGTKDAGIAVPDNLVGIKISIVVPSLLTDGYMKENHNLSTVDKNNYAICITTQHSPILTEIYSEQYYDNMWEYKGTRTAALRAVVEKDESVGRSYWAPGFYDCCVASDVSVTADCTLFGIPAGGNLIDHCIMTAVDRRSHYICSYPDFVPIGLWKENMLLANYLAKGNALPTMGEFAAFIFDSIPEDMPERFKMTISIPIQYNSWASFDWTSLNNIPLLSENRSLEDSIEVRLLSGIVDE